MLLLLAAARVGTADAQVITIETEWFIDSHDTGGTPIGILADAGCSGGLLLIGLDRTDEWTSYDVPVEAPGVYAPRIVCRGNAGVDYHMQLTLSPDTLGGSQTVDFFFTGIGFG